MVMSKRLFIFVFGILLVSLFFIGNVSAKQVTFCNLETTKIGCEPDSHIDPGLDNCVWTDYNCPDYSGGEIPPCIGPNCYPESLDPNSCKESSVCIGESSLCHTNVEFNAIGGTPGCQDKSACNELSDGCFLKDQCITSTDLGTIGSIGATYSKTASWKGPGWFCDGCRLHKVGTWNGNVYDITQNGNCNTCKDGIQNGDETGIDCGGNYCESCTVVEPPEEPEVYWAAFDSSDNAYYKITSPPTRTKNPSNNRLFMIMENPPAGFTWEFQIYEEDVGADDNIRVDANAIDPFSVSTEKIIAEWPIAQNDIDNAKFLGIGENPYEFYFEAVGTQGPSTPGPVNPGPSGPASPPLNILSIITGKQVSNQPGNGEQAPEQENLYLSEILEITWEETVSQTCQINSVTWEEDEVFEGEQVDLEVTTNSACDGSDMTFSVRGTDTTSDPSAQPANVQIVSGSAIGDWTAQPDGTYDFVASVGSEIQVSDNELTVKPADFCSSVAVCANYDTEAKCNNDANLCGVAGTTDPTCGNPSCSWDSVNSKCVEVCEEDSIGSCFYSSVGDDTCEPGDISITYTWTGAWTWDSGNSFGGSSQADCSAGQIFSQGACRNDPEGEAAKCALGGTDTITCPGQVQLPLTNWFSIIATVMVIAFIYFLTSRRIKD